MSVARIHTVVLISSCFDLLPNAKGSVPVPGGTVRVEWKSLSRTQCNLVIESKTEAPATVALPPGWAVGDTGARVVQVSGNRPVHLLCATSSL